MKKLHILLLLFSSSFLFSQNSGLLFNGVDTRVVIADKEAFNIVDGYTMEAWIYANEWKGQSWQGSIINKDAQGPDRGFAFRAGANGTLSFVISVDGVWVEAQSQAIMNTEQWHHVAMTIGNGLMILYIDGEPVANQTYDGNFRISDMDLTIGASPGFGERHFDGIIDEIRLWNVVRSGADIAANTDVALTGSEPNLVGYFPMNEGSGMVMGNLVDASCSGALTNMTDANWVDGFTRPDYDISVQPIQGIDVVNIKSRPLQIPVQLKNLGLEDINGVDVNLYVDDNLIFTESQSGTIASGEQLDFYLDTPVDLVGLDNPTLAVEAVFSNDQNELNNRKELTIVTLEGDRIRLFDNEVHNFGADGQNQFSNVVLPGDLSKYEQILLHIDLSCPTGGCDPWDQPAKISAATDAGTFEIARYVTPYMIACGPWTVDITDFKSILAGPVSFHSYIQVWGPNGWALTLDLELIEGDIDLPYTKLSPLWQEDYWVYGDPDIEDDLPAVSVDVAPQSESSHIRMTISGHGQGNTDNAAEFSPKTHQFTLNGSNVDNHELWKNDCASNPCADQQGTWTFPRAGWCPGQEVIPYWVTTGPQSGTISLDYELEEYTNLLNTGYNGSSHTEPHYRIWSYFVESSSTPYVNYLNLFASSIEANFDDMDVLTGIQMVIGNDGYEEMSDIRVRYYQNYELVTDEAIGVSLAPGEELLYQFQTIQALEENAESLLFGVVYQDNDETPGDNIVKNSYGMTSSLDPIEEALNRVSIFPNPSNNGSITIAVDETLLGSTLRITNAQGITLDSKKINDVTHTEQIDLPGYYFLNLETSAGQNITKTIVIVQ